MTQELRKTKIKVLSEERSKAFQEAVFAAGGEWLHGEKLYREGINFIFLNDSLRMTYCDNAVFFQEHDYKEIQFPFPIKDISTKHKEETQVKQILIHVDGLTIEEKQRVAKALAKIKNIGMCDPTHWSKVDTLYGPSFDGINVGFNYYKDANPTHSPQQVLEMARMEKKGHVHAELMAQYAEDAKTSKTTWELWQVRCDKGVWHRCLDHPKWGCDKEYRRKPITKLIHGTEVPDLSFTPKVGEGYYFICLSSDQLVKKDFHSKGCLTTKLRAVRSLCYPDTAEGRQAAILHAEALLNID